MGDCLDQPASASSRFVWPSRSYVTSAAGELHPEPPGAAGDRQGRVGSGARSISNQGTAADNDESREFPSQKAHPYRNVVHAKTQPHILTQDPRSGKDVNN